MLSWNAQNVKNLTPNEIWLFIVSRVFMGFGAGALLAKYAPRIVGPIALPVLIVGLIFFFGRGERLEKADPK